MLDVDLGVNLEDLTFQDLKQNKRGLYKCVVRADQLPNDNIILHPLKKGDAIFLSSANINETYWSGII